ncbi:hypothetical protein E3N88_21026 [Mikania micrantha]|uniref:Uncharacterized protein n=1 Tax=Mikania micrantha TaxID=192012 RepID=A0A5N6NKK9_9ASTR|nr:hypothetical protein E3N88_21026 [Mikania micrantha]
MKMGLLGSSGDLSRYATVHKDTVAIRDKWRGKFERGTLSRYARGTLDRVALRDKTQFGVPHPQESLEPQPPPFFLSKSATLGVPGAVHPSS